MKKILSVISAAAMIAALASCSAQETVSEENAPAEALIDIIEEETLPQPEESSADASGTGSGSEIVSLSSDKNIEEVIAPPDAEFLRSIFKGNDEMTIFTLDANGNYSESSEESMYEIDGKQIIHDYIIQMLSEEYYEENKEQFDEMDISSYEEYKAMIEEFWGNELLDEYDEYLEYEPEDDGPFVYFIIGTSNYSAEAEDSDRSDEEIFLRTARRLFERINENPEIAGKITERLENGEYYYAAAHGEYTGKNVIRISSGFLESADNNSYIDESPFYLEESIPASGENGFVIGNTFVPSDTESLFISSRDEGTALMLADDIIPEGCLIVCTDYDKYDNAYKLEFDFAMIAENLPNLKELYMYQASGTNTEAISELKNLESLSYYISLDMEYPYQAKPDIPFRELPKLKNLRIYGEYEDYGFLNEIPPLESVYVRVTKEMPLDSLFECSAVTSLEIEEFADLNGIEKLTNLESLTINFSEPDLAPVGKLKNLKYLKIYCHGGVKNISALGNLSGLEELFLHSLDNYDWNFLKNLKNVKKLSVMYVEDIYNEDVKQMPWLEELSMTEVMTTYSLIGEMPNLKSVHVGEIRGTPDDFSGSETLESYSELFGRSGVSYECLGKCPKLKEIMLMGCNGNVNAEDLSGLPLESIYLDGTNVKNPLALGKIGTLKYMYLTDSAADEELIEQLSEMLPDCEINSGADFFHNTAY